MDDQNLVQSLAKILQCLKMQSSQTERACAVRYQIDAKSLDNNEDKLYS